MSDAMTMIGAAGMLTLAFAMLALTQDVHWTRVTGGAPVLARPKRRRIRALAGIGLAAGLALCLGGHGAGFGSLLWALLSGATGVAVAFLLAWYPGLFSGLARVLAGNRTR